MISASTGNYKNALVEALRDFRSVQDPDVQDFLNKKAIDFEQRGWATTYILLSQEEFLDGNLSIEAYFSLTHKAMVFKEDVSLSLRQKLTGSKKSQTGSFVLIGQLGKRVLRNDDGTYTKANITAKEILDDALSVIQQSSNYIVCKNIIIECKPIPKIKDIYEDYGFVELQFDNKDQLHTLYLKMHSEIKF